ncbi:LLM class flavin-dependent oxidoreductase [Amycolatopsis sp. GM8]|uniref:LLM class flavin-dependent oxidoreductase n=1 Tax=Amycolatopsis sp. GM8 TaxID=2896530 RepID=UPI001F377F7E|nr:LLM class flavin-dependent oxidoreductase [Amycolatopsis sp. GM8]
MRIGIGLPNQVRNVDPTVIPRWAAKAEEAGFSTLGTVGRHAFPGVSDTVALTAAAAATSRIGLMPGVLLAPTWPGAVLAKELAGIDGISGGRLTLGIGVGNRPDDFVLPEYGLRGRGARLDRDLETFRDVWDGKAVGGGPNPAVPAGTRQIPMLFGGWAPAALARMVRWGSGYIGGAMPAAMVAPSYEAAKTAWTEAGREGSPRFVALSYFALGDVEAARANVGAYYLAGGDELARMVVEGMSISPEKVKATIADYEALGADEIVFNPGTGDLAEIERLAALVF